MTDFRSRALAAIGIPLAIIVRLALLPGEGLRGDLDYFATKIAHIANEGLANAYSAELSWGPVVTVIWAILGAVEPGFRTAVDASDPSLRVLIKLPAVLADVGLAAVVAYGLRARPAWAVAGGMAILLHPAIWYVSAWWGQYDSVWALGAVAAAVLAINGRNGFAAAALALAVLTKPQALPLILPFAAWFLSQGGVAGVARAALIGTAVAVVAWLPFVGAGGPADYLASLRDYQDDVYSVLSLRAWNPWWLLQLFAGGGDFVVDRDPLVGPVSFRLIGYAVAGLLTLLVAYRVWRDPRPWTLVMGLAASTLISFTFLTTMHERYTYAAIPFLMLLVSDARARIAGVILGILVTLNVVAVSPLVPELRRLVPVDGVISVAASATMLALTIWTMLLLRVRPAAP